VFEDFDSDDAAFAPHGFDFARSIAGTAAAAQKRPDGAVYNVIIAGEGEADAVFFDSLAPKPLPDFTRRRTLDLPATNT
jgi:hypothetical protein